MELLALFIKIDNRKKYDKFRFAICPLRKDFSSLKGLFHKLTFLSKWYKMKKQQGSSIVGGPSTKINENTNRDLTNGNLKVK